MTTVRSLKLVRPLVVFDLETTGLDVEQDRIVEIATVTLHPDGSRASWARRVNPGRAIPAGATAVHGIRDVDVRDAPPFARLAPELLARLAGADLSGFNVLGFDLPFLAREFGRAGHAFPADGTRVVDALAVYRLRERRDLTAAVAFYCGREHAGAHGALADSEAAADVLLAQVLRYPDLPADVAALQDACRPSGALDFQGKFVWREGEAVFTFGKHANKPLRQVAARDASYLEWMISSGSFLPDAKAIARDALAGRMPRLPG